MANVVKKCNCSNDGVQARVLSFLERIRDDPRIKPSHISLFIVLSTKGEIGASVNYGTQDRACILNEAKISVTTFQRCIHDLHDFGYLQYFPSYNPKIKNKLFLYDDE